MSRIRALALMAGLFALAGTLRAAEEAKKPAATKPVDLVICLDVSGSMNGLLDSARLRIWDVVNELAKVKPTPVLRVAVYSFGGQGPDYPPNKGYIRKEIDLTTDLDAVYEKLTNLKITGHIEYATGVSKAALDEQKWSEEKNALKVIFVCGNEAADQDKGNPIEDVAKLAKEKGVYLNAIYCGADNDGIAPGWRQIAELGGGKYANIDMNKAKQQVINTPFDKEIAELSGKLNATYVVYGREGAAKADNQKVQDANAAKAAPAAAAARGEAKGGANYRNESWDLVDKLKMDPKFDVKSVKEEELCDEMKKLKPEERQAFLKKKLEEREGIAKQIAELAVRRGKHIEEELKKAPKTESEKSLDDALKATIRAQAKDRGFEVVEKK